MIRQVVPLAAMLLLGRAANAQEPVPYEPPSRANQTSDSERPARRLPRAAEGQPSEPDFAAIQIVGAGFAMAGAGLFLVWLPSVLFPPAALIGLAFSPAIGGLVVCGIGRSSRYYDGSCGAATLGAYLGGLTALPLAYLGCGLDGGDEDGCWKGAVVGALVGYLVGTAVGATIGWQVTKERRVADRPFTLGPTPATTQPGEIRVTVPLLAFSF